MKIDEEDKEELRDKSIGIAAGATKALIAGVGVVAGGPLAAIGAGFAAELVSVIIPNFKKQRYEKWVADFASRIDALEGEVQKRAREYFHTPEFADLFEDAARQAVRALSDERIKQVNSILIKSLTDDDVKHAERKRLLEIFGQMNDIEVLLLQSMVFTSYIGEVDDFWSKHPNLIPEPVYIGSPQEDIDKESVFNSYRECLVNLGLATPAFVIPRRGDFPEFDQETGKIKSRGYNITTLGRLLLHEIGLKEPIHEQREDDKQNE